MIGGSCDSCFFFGNYGEFGSFHRLGGFFSIFSQVVNFISILFFQTFDLSKYLFQLFTFLVSPSLTFVFVLMFTLLPQLYLQDFVDFFIRNHFQFLEDVFHKCLDNSDIQPFYSAINSLDHDLKFIFEF